MRILVLNGSPHPDGATADMVAAFEKGAKEAGHDVVTFSVARMNVKGCLGCSLENTFFRIVFSENKILHQKDHM